MKKLLFAALFAVSTLTVSAQRFSATGLSGGNTGADLNYFSYTRTLASTDSIRPNAFRSYYTFDTLKAAKTLIIKTFSAKKFDEVSLEFKADTLTAGRVVTFSSGSSANSSLLWTTTSGNTITVKKQKSAIVVFMFDGTYWCEKSRSVQY